MDKGMLAGRAWRFLWPAAGACFLSGCLYTSHHFNDGRLLAPGTTAVTMGVGVQPFENGYCADFDAALHGSPSGPICERFNYVPDSAGLYHNDTVPAFTKTSGLPTLSFGYRLGVRKKWGPFTGAELGWRLEAPTNPGSAEFDLKLGLPTPVSEKLQHSLSAGWIVGMWVDNSFFLEYAAGRPFGANALFGNVRATLLATQPDDLIDDDAVGPAAGFSQRRRYAWQASAGFHWRLPEIAVVPDFLVPMASVTWPALPALDGNISPIGDLQWNFNLGIGWDFQ